jgi:2-hydroxy-3-oxopropionate reductase
MSQTVGFVGLGIMGRPMASNLMKAGYKLVVYDVDRAPVEALVREGAEAAATPREVGSKAGVIVSMLPDDAVVEKVALGENGLIEGMAPGSILVDMSTISPTTARRVAGVLQSRGMDMVDAPVSGGDVGAIEGSLSIMAGGRPEAFARVKPLLEKMGRNINLIGGNGAGQVAKACNQIVVGLTIAAVSEALIFAKKAGVDPAKVRKALLGGFAHSRVLELHGQRMLDRNFKPGGKVRLHKKDTDIAIEAAKELGIFLPNTAFLAQLWNALAAQGGLDLDHSSIVKVLEAMCSTEVCPGCAEGE